MTKPAACSADDNRIRRITGGKINTVATLPSGSQAQGMAVDFTSGTIYVSTGSTTCQVLAVSSSTGTATVVAGTGTCGYGGDGGPATSAQLGATNGLTINANGDILVADVGNNLIRKLSVG